MLEKYVCAWTRRLLGGRARGPLDDVASTCVCGCRRVYDFARFVYLLYCRCVCALVLQKIESDSRDSACEPAPSPLLRSSLTHAHRCIGPRNPTRPTPTSARLMCLGVSDNRDSIYTLSLSLAHDLPTFPRSTCCVRDATLLECSSLSFVTPTLASPSPLHTTSRPSLLHLVCERRHSPQALALCLS